MKSTLTFIIIFAFHFISLGQLPSCVKEKCEIILKKELGNEIFNKYVHFEGYKCKLKLDSVTGSPCKSFSRHEYLVKFSFTFPKIKTAKLNLGFICTGFYGDFYVQSALYYRSEQSDLPKDFINKGFDLINYNIIKSKACKTDSLIQKQFTDGTLAIVNDKIYWVFEANEPYENKTGDAEMYTNHVIYIDPYTGEICFYDIKSY